MSIRYWLESESISRSVTRHINDIVYHAVYPLFSILSMKREMVGLYVAAIYNRIFYFLVGTALIVSIFYYVATGNSPGEIYH
jgi:hypothetical protein